MQSRQLNDVTCCDQSDTTLTKRRSVLVQSLVTILAAVLPTGEMRAAPKRAAISDEELAPFRKIAKEKGVKLFLRDGPPRARAQSEMHLDMDMIRASLDNAIERAKKQRRNSLEEKLSKLRTRGTAAQQIEFVMGSGRYFFPEDLETLAAEAEKNKFHTFGAGCSVFCWLSCICLGDMSQECRQRCREICERL